MKESFETIRDKITSMDFDELKKMLEVVIEKNIPGFSKECLKCRDEDTILWYLFDLSIDELQTVYAVYKNNMGL